jgi:hypothetical protein
LKAKAYQKIGSHVFAPGEPVIYFDTAKTSTLETASSTVYATGGRGNNRLIAWEGEKTLTFTFEEALLSQTGLAVLSGADLIQANGESITVKAHTTEQIAISEDNKIVLSKPAYRDGEAYVMLLDGNGEVSGVPVKATVAEGGTITVAEGLIKKGDVVLVDYYTEHKSDAVQVDITPDKFAGYYYLEADTLFRRESDGVDLPAEFILPKVKIQTNFTFTMAASGDPSTFTFTLDAFPDYTKFDRTKKVLASIQVLNADDNYDLNPDELAPNYEYGRFQYNEDTKGNYLWNDKTTGQTKDDTKVGE